MSNFPTAFLQGLGVVVLLAMFVLLIRATAKDAIRRGKSPALVCLVGIITFPWGLIFWLLFRPDPIDGAGIPVRLEDHRIQ
jgi:hypothetical protein